MMPRLVLALVVPNRTTTLHLHACSQNRRTRSRESTMCCYGNLFIVIVMNSLYVIQDKERKNVCGTTRGPIVAAARCAAQWPVLVWRGRIKVSRFCIYAWFRRAVLRIGLSSFSLSNFQTVLRPEHRFVRASSIPEFPSSRRDHCSIQYHAFWVSVFFEKKKTKWKRKIKWKRKKKGISSE